MSGTGDNDPRPTGDDEEGRGTTRPDRQEASGEDRRQDASGEDRSGDGDGGADRGEEEQEDRRTVGDLPTPEGLTSPGEGMDDAPTRPRQSKDYP